MDKQGTYSANVPSAEAASPFTPLVATVDVTSVVEEVFSEVEVAETVDSLIC